MKVEDCRELVDLLIEAGGFSSISSADKEAEIQKKIVACVIRISDSDAITAGAMAIGIMKVSKVIKKRIGEV